MRMGGAGKLTLYFMNYAHDTVFIAETREHLLHIVSEFERA